MLTPDNVVMSVRSLVVGRNYAIQTKTNLTSAVWSNETNFVAAQTAYVFTNSTADSPQKFYRVYGY